MATKVIAICNQKGGTGKTTTAINLCVALAMTNKRVLLVDLDPQANATSGLGIDKTSVKQGVYNVLIDEESALSLLMPTYNERLSILPANIDLTGAEIELVALIGREYRLRKGIEPIKNEFDFIIIDSPPSLGLLTINSLTAAGSILIPVQCEYYALEGLSQLMNTINLVKDNLNASLEIEGLLLTMADYRTNLTQEVILEVRRHFKDKVFKTVIPRNIRLSEAPSFGKPIFIYDRDSIGAKKYWQLACEMLGADDTQLLENKKVKCSEPSELVRSDVHENIVEAGQLVPPAV